MNSTLWLYWEGPKPQYIQVCEELLSLYNPTAKVLSPKSLLDLGFPRDIWDAIQSWHVAQRSDAIRTWLLYEFGGMWCDIDCIPMQSYQPFITLAHACNSGVAAYDSTDGTIGVGFIASRARAEPIMELWKHIESVAKSGRPPRWLEVSTEPFTKIVREFGRERFLLWPLNHISPISWREQHRFLERGPDSKHWEFVRGFPSAWCWMLCNHVLSQSDLAQWTRYEIFRSDTLLSYLVRRSLAGEPHHIPRGRAVATLNVHNDRLPHNFRESMRHAAKRWGADFVEIRTPIVPWYDPMWEKLNLDRHLQDYERVVFFDRDVVVSSKCPNLFEIVAEDEFGAVPSEQPGHNLIDIHIRPAMEGLCNLMNCRMDYERDYVNTGVLVFSPPRHKHVFSLARALHPIPWIRNWVTIDQGILAIALLISKAKVHRLPIEFNRCGAKLWDHWQLEMDDFIWHFCGPKNWSHMVNTRWC